MKARRMNDSAISGSWDVIVIGAGLGGGICGRALAEAGLRVLFVDRGDAWPRGASVPEGLRDPAGARLPLGVWPGRMRLTVDGVSREARAPQRVGAGGTSVFYAASLERPERHDLEATAAMPHPTGGWPVAYDAFRPWFDRAQRLMELEGTPDPRRAEPLPTLRMPPALSASDTAMVRRMQENGLAPYRTHLALRRLSGCLECIGQECPRACKLDGRSAGVEPALATGRAAFLGQATVRRVCGGRDGITHLEVERSGTTLQLSARAYVLAAGALGSAHLLLGSASEAWPQGFANDSGLLGRGLMFHLGERLAIWPPRGHDMTGPRKTLSLRDFYARDGKRLGLVQALGLRAGYGDIVQVLNECYDRTVFHHLPAARGALRIPALAAAKILGRAQIYIGILEDLPIDGNRVRFDASRPDSFIVDYHVTPELTERRRLFRREIRRGLRGMRTLFLNWDVELNLAHPSGTLRFSDDPRKGVLDRDCRAHGIGNLYVADSSFMPTSTGVNPSLTITANALRVADTLARRLRGTSG